MPETSTDVSDLLHRVQTPQEQPIQNNDDVASTEHNEDAMENTSSFIPRLPSSMPELDAIRTILHLDTTKNNVIRWPQISSSPINEYNT